MEDRTKEEGEQREIASELRQRIITGGALIGGFLLFVIAAGLWCFALKALLVLGLCVVGGIAYETARLIGPHLEDGATPAHRLGVAALTAVLTLPAICMWVALSTDQLCPMVTAPTRPLAAFTAGLVIMYGLLALVVVASPRRSLEQTGMLLADLAVGGALVGMCGALMLGLSAFGDAAWTYLWLVAVTASNDIAAFFAGRSIGGPRMAPVLSPGKTVAGSVAGLLVGSLVAFILARLIGLPPWSLQALFFGFVVVIAAQIADLLKSYLKRARRVKESGSLLPGHGGLLDRCDAVLGGGAALYLIYLLQHYPVL